jgi:hypothetical protein
MENFARPENGSQRPLEVYGGVTRSAACLVRKIDGDVMFMPSPFLPLVVPDVALSAIADTVTLPVTVPVSMIRAIDKAFYEGMRDTYFPEKTPGPKEDDIPAQLVPERIHGGII